MTATANPQRIEEIEKICSDAPLSSSSNYMEIRPFYPHLVSLISPCNELYLDETRTDVTAGLVLGQLERLAQHHLACNGQKGDGGAAIVRDLFDVYVTKSSLGPLFIRNGKIVQTEVDASSMVRTALFKLGYDKEARYLQEAVLEGSEHEAPEYMLSGTQP